MGGRLRLQGEGSIWQLMVFERERLQLGGDGPLRHYWCSMVW